MGPASRRGPLHVGQALQFAAERKDLPTYAVVPQGIVIDEQPREGRVLDRQTVQPVRSCGDNRLGDRRAFRHGPRPPPPGGLIATGPNATLQAPCPPAKLLELLAQGGELRVYVFLPSRSGPP